LPRTSRPAPDQIAASRPHRRHAAVACAIAAVVVTASACSSSGGSKDNGTGSKKLTAITVNASFPYAAGQYSCLYDYGKAKGFFAKHGVDPTFGDATGSVALISEVAAGKVDFGFSAAASNVMQAVDKGAAVKIIGVQERDAPTAVISSKANPITKPADLKGKKIAYGASTLGGVGLRLLLQQNGMSISDVQVVNVQTTAYASSLKSGAIDGYVSYPSSSFPTLEKLGVQPEQMLLRSFGFNPVPADTYIASDSYIQKNPDVVKGFLAGAHDTWAYMAAHADAPAAAAKNCVGKHVGVSEDQAEKQIKLVLEANADQLKDKNFQQVDTSALQAQIDILNKAGQLPDPKSPDNYFTNAYLPSAS
jgi:NitT/TauT family transport system substrate-binding protein